MASSACTSAFVLASGVATNPQVQPGSRRAVYVFPQASRSLQSSRGPGGRDSSWARTSSTRVCASASTGALLPSRSTTASAVTGTPLSQAGKDISVFKSDGTPVPLLSLWVDRKAVVAWVRHYGCLLCRKRAAALADKKAEMDAAGVALAVVGPASVEQAAAFLEQTQFPGEVYADPEHKSFEALAFASGVQTVLNPKMVRNTLAAQQEGFRTHWGLSLQPATVARGIWQQGGVLVAGPGADTVEFLHRDEVAGDEPDFQKVMDACCRQMQ